MTDQPNDQAPDLDAAIVKTAEHIRDAFAPLAAGLREAWDTMRPLIQSAARDAETQTAAHYALAACFEEDDADTHLNGLDAEQLRDIIGAANLLAEKADARHAALTTIPEETETR